MSTQTKQRPPTSDSQVTEEGLLIYATDQPVVETVSGDCKLFVDMVDKGFSFPGFEKLQKPKLKRDISFSRIMEEEKEKAAKRGAGGVWPPISFFWVTFSMIGFFVIGVYFHFFFFALSAVSSFLFTDPDVQVYPRTLWRWSRDKKEARVSQRDPVTEKELMDYLMDVFSSQQDGKTITELKQYRKGLEKKRKEVEKRKKGPEKRLSDKVREVYADQIDSVIQNAEAKLEEIQDVQNRIDAFIRDVKEETEKWIDEFFPHYEDNQYCADWIQESIEVLSVTDEAIEKAEVKLIKAEQQFLERTKMLSELLTNANLYRASLAEVSKDNYNDLRKLRD